MLEESDDPVVKTVQPSIKTGRKWKVAEAIDEAKEYVRLKEVIGQTQTDRKGLGSSSVKWWSKTEGKEKRDMVIDEVRQREDVKRIQKAVQQSQQEVNRWILSGDGDKLLQLGHPHFAVVRQYHWTG
ncbi:reverse transcriptase [Elysia marginata]|uniref:Reverse transcriptase n=1 Tax=Elysia marginata TaxID=1093978 RepID=A0AAV4HRA6_9GAST|nr:reverse transcriptase [Elysia marginata]